jgi:hypothetical protein
LSPAREKADAAASFSKPWVRLHGADKRQHLGQESLDQPVAAAEDACQSILNGIHRGVV